MDDNAIIEMTMPDHTKATLPLIALNAWSRLFDQGVDIARNPNRPTEPFSQVAWVYICVDKIIQTASAIPLMLSDQSDQVIESGPVYEFLYNNPAQPLRRFIQTTLGYLAMFRECYWVKTSDNGAAAGSLAVYGPNKLKPSIRRGVVTGYMLHTDSGLAPLFLEDVIPLLGFNPDSPHHGVGPLSAGKLDISSSYQATQFNEATLANGARIGGLISVPQGVKLDENEKKFLIAQFEARHAGSRNAGRIGLLTGGADFKTFTQTMAELDMVNSRRFDASTICALFGVPPEIVGLNSEAQYAHGPASQRLVTDTLAPMLSFIADHLNDHVLPAYAGKGYKAVDAAACRQLSRMPLHRRQSWRAQKVKAVQSARRLWAWFAIEDHPAVQEMLRDRAEKMLKYNDKGVPLNQIIDAGDLPFEHTPAGEFWWVQMGLVPAQWTLDAGPEALNAPALPEGQADEEEGEEKQPEKSLSVLNEKANEAQRLRIWRKYIASFAALEKEMTGQIRLLFVQQQKDLVGKLKSAWDEFKSLDKQKANENIIARVVFDLRKEDGKLKVINRVFFERGAKLGAAQTLTELGTAADQVTAQAAQITQQQAVRQAIQVSSHKISKVNATTQTRVARQLTEGLAKGEGLPELTNRIKDTLGGNLKRAQAIARTQTSSAVSSGRFAGMKVGGGKMKSWLTARDPQVRKEHQAAEKTYADGIAVDQPFIVGGETLMYPGDPSGTAAMIANCRCLLLALYGTRAASLEAYDRMKFVSYAELKTLLKEV